jgi:hypothetical protein
MSWGILYETLVIQCLVGSLSETFVAAAANTVPQNLREEFCKIAANT